MEEADLSIRRGCGADLAAYRRGLRRTFDPRGRATRTELAMVFALPLVLAVIPGLILEHVFDRQWLDLVALALWVLVLLPLPAAAVRRFHDRAKSGWLALPMVLACAAIIRDAWLDYAAGPFASHRLLGEQSIVLAAAVVASAFYLAALFRPPVDEGNPYGTNPRPPEKPL